jgi:hypothetical protein
LSKYYRLEIRSLNHQPLKGVYHMAIKVYNGLPYELKAISSYPQKFKANLKDFLYTNSFYTWKNFLTDDGFHFLNILLKNIYALID